MNVRHLVLSSVALMALARASCVVAGEAPDQPILGPAEPIGELLLVKAGFDDEPSATDLLPLPPVPVPLLLERLTAIPVDAPLPFNNIPGNPQFDHAEAISFHLAQAVQGLRLAGCAEESERAASLLKDFQSRHQARLQLAAKLAQLNELQAEVEQLKLRVEKGITADQVSISIRIIETEDVEARRLLSKAGSEDESPKSADQNAAVIEFSTHEFQKLMARLEKDECVRLLCAPTLVVRSGQRGEMRTGGSLPTPVIALAGGPKEIEFGTKVTATPTITDNDEVRLVVEAEVSELDHANGVTLNGEFVPGKNQTRVQSTIKQSSGNTTVLGGLIRTHEGKEKSTFFAVTTEILESSDEAMILVPPRPIPVPEVK